MKSTKYICDNSKDPLLNSLTALLRYPYAICAYVCAYLPNSKDYCQTIKDYKAECLLYIIWSNTSSRFPSESDNSY